MIVRHAIILAILCYAVLACTDSSQPSEFEPDAVREQSALPTNERQLTFRYHWLRFLAEFLTDDGRVIDVGSERSVSTSEGQAYGLFFALVANDPEHFDLMLRWADRNLTQDGIDAQLPAWLWGQDLASGAWQILDSNPATDADVWMAYALLEGGRLWDNPQYTALGTLLADRVLNEVTTTIADELILLPAPEGFIDGSIVRLNPSYASLSVFRGLASLHDTERWEAIYESSLRLLELNSTHQNGLFSDWINVTTDFSIASNNSLLGSYDAIRTYLWLYLEYSKGDQRIENLVNASRALVDFTAQRQTPPLRIYDSKLEGVGSVGFSIVLAPYLSLFDESLALSQHQRLIARGLDGYTNRYYDTMLILFGLGAGQCFWFDEQGLLQVNWHASHC